MPDRIATPPTTAAALLDWARAHPNRFMNARPANSGPGRTFMMGLPYLLGDADPKDPVNGWAKTWAYLEAMNPAIEYYPSGTGATMKELGEGSRDMIVSTTGWDINPRVLGIVPKEARIATLQGFHWVSDAFFMTVPKGIPEDRLAAVLAMMRFVLEPAQQAVSYDEGYLYPGPAIRNVPALHGPREEPGRHPRLRPPRIRRPHRQHPDRTPLDARPHGGGLPPVGREDRLQEGRQIGSTPHHSNTVSAITRVTSCMDSSPTLSSIPWMFSASGP